MGNIPQGWGKKVRNKKRGGISFSDRSQMAYNHVDLVKEYEWRGNNLVWNGLMVGSDEVDTPNPNVRPFQYKKEGVLPPNVRPEQAEVTAPSNEERLRLLQQTVWDSN